MVDSSIISNYEMMIDFPTEWGSNLVGTMPFVLPLLFGAILLLLYQRYLPSKEPVRNIIILVAILGIAGGFILILYAGFGSMWWVPGDYSFGAYDTFYAVLQRVSDMIFEYQIIYFLIYLSGTVIIFSLMARYVITPPDPDFVSLRDKLKELSDTSESVAKEKNELEAENKKLNEFLKEKEDTLEVLQSELEGLKVSVSERETSIAEMESRLTEAPEDETVEQELLQTISKKDETISKLQSDIMQLQQVIEDSAKASEGAPTTEAAPMMGEEMEQKLKSLTAQIDDYSRRAETASEVSDSVISDLAELISQIESSGLDESTKKALTGLIEGLGRSIGRIVGKPAEKDDKPKVELIGAVMMVHEIVDSVKKLTRT